MNTIAIVEITLFSIGIVVYFILMVLMGIIFYGRQLYPSCGFQKNKRFLAGRWLYTLMYLLSLQLFLRLISMVILIIMSVNTLPSHALQIVTSWTFLLPFSTMMWMFTAFLFIWSEVINELFPRLRRLIIATRLFCIFAAILFIIVVFGAAMNSTLFFSGATSFQAFEITNIVVIYVMAPIYVLCFFINTILLIVMTVRVGYELKYSPTKSHVNPEWLENKLGSLKRIGIGLAFVIISFLAMMIGAPGIMLSSSNFIFIFAFSVLPEWSTDIAVIITFWPWRILTCAYFSKKQNLEQVQTEGDLYETLNNQQLLNAFLEFCKNERSDDNLKFWLKVEEFKKINDRHERRQAAIRIFEECFGNSSTVNITDTNKLKLKLQLEDNQELKREFFKQVQEGD